MRQILFIVATGTVAVAVTFCCSIQRSTRNALDNRMESKRLQGEELAAMSAEHERLSNVVAQLNSSPTCSSEERAELLRLRSEVGRLRGSTRQLEQLQTSNERLRAGIASADEQLAKARSAPNFWPKDQLDFAGYATPEAAVKSFLWSMCKGDVSGWQSVCTPEAWAEREEGWSRRGASAAKRESELKSMASDLTSPSVGFHVVEQKLTPPDQASVTVSFDGEGRVRTFILRRIENAWKLHDLEFAGQADQ